MFKNSLAKYLMSVAAFAPLDEAASAAAAAQRAAISNTVTVSARSEHEAANEKEIKDEGKDNEENDDDNDGKDENEEDGPSDDDGKGKDIENETEEQKQARLAAEEDDAKDQRRKDRIQKRIDKLTATVGSKDAEIARLQAQLNEQPREGLTEEEIERRAQARADELTRQNQQEFNKKQFDKDCEIVQKAAIKIDKDFNTKIHQVVAETETPIPGEMIAFLTDLDNENAGDVLAHLADNVDLYEEVTSSTPSKMQLKLIRISDKLKAAADEAKKAPKKVHSKVPAPIAPITEGRNQRGDEMPSKPTENMEAYVRARNAQDAAKRKARGF